jgi:RNA polymerase sigma-70 factor (ECF subfamily)
MMVIDDTLLVERFRQGDRTAAQAIVQKHNQMLWRVARGIVRDDIEAEDVLQEAYARAFAHLSGFRGEAGLFTWLTRITINEARGRLRKRRVTVGLDQVEAAQAAGPQVVMFPSGGLVSQSPESDAARAQIRRLIEAAVDDLPEAFRMVFVLRDLDQLTVEETAVALDLAPATVKTRLHRARRLLRAALDRKLAATLTDAFPFLGVRCERITEAVLARLAHDFAEPSPSAPIE